MRLIKQPTGFLAVQPFQGLKEAVNVAGWGKTRLEAMAACTDLVAAMRREVGR